MLKLRPGKLDPDLLSRLLAENEIEDERVVVRPGVGRDVCAIRRGEKYLIAKTDPITFATSRIGWYVVHVNANDIATVGARPSWFLVTVLLPEKDTDEALVQGIWNDLRQALDGIDCELCGGHTEVTVGLDRPILVGQMLAEVDADRLVDKKSTRAGDRVLITKGAPVEGTAIMAFEKGDLLADSFSPDDVERAREFLEKPGISVLTEALAACDAGDVHAMHDPTEGGVATGLWELAKASHLGMLIHAKHIPLIEPGVSFCQELGLDPLGTISSGTLLICVDADNAEAIREAVRSQGIACRDIGEMRPEEEGIVLERDGKRVPMPTFPQDEISRLFK